MNIQQAIDRIDKLKHASKYDAMVKTAAIITKLLEEDRSRPFD